MAPTRSDLEADTDHVDLVLVDVDTGARRRLTHLDAVNASPAFSSDGTGIAFLSSRDGAPQLYVLALDGGEARAVTAVPRGVCSGPSWSPDDTRIAFTAHGRGEPRDPSRPYRVGRAHWSTRPRSTPTPQNARHGEVERSVRLSTPLVLKVSAWPHREPFALPRRCGKSAVGEPRTSSAGEGGSQAIGRVRVEVEEQ